MKILQNFVAFSEYMNFINLPYCIKASECSIYAHLLKLTAVLQKHLKILTHNALQCTEVRFASFLSSGFTTMAVINPPEIGRPKNSSN